MIGVTILGATGSIGTSTLDVLSRNNDKFNIVALTANSNIDKLFEQCKEFKPLYAVVVNAEAADKLKIKLESVSLDIQVLSGVASLDYVASLNETDYVVAAIVGAAGLSSSLAAAKASKRILLANKETLVMSGQLFMDEVAKNKATLLPVDSEHNAIYQCLQSFNGSQGLSDEVRKIYLTASGGPFRKTDLKLLDSVTPEQACAHPNWSMGRKISVDSATMMNKGLELIEACWLFSAGVDDVQITIHPQSIIHSMVEFIDGSVMAQLGQPDMRTPIAYALAWPERIESGVQSLDLFSMSSLEFEKPDHARFPCIKLAENAMREGGIMPAVLNAANEIAVQAFLDNEIAFMAISGVVENVLEQTTYHEVNDIQTVVTADSDARLLAYEVIKSMATGIVGSKNHA
ncbi:1-deoxy-D-xylulose 5-phosphate reductoisomerase [hydrothermal vent metagenome]|uniref:1-deoxy-D-xylulose-5-phosphate reductoisomerase n=1 Tax=hydrothermal vent metagenome TaxID=652676 RepID=A0A3B1A0H4_9ZZZZ